MEPLYHWLNTLSIELLFKHFESRITNDLLSFLSCEFYVALRIAERARTTLARWRWRVFQMTNARVNERVARSYVCLPQFRSLKFKGLESERANPAK